MNRGVPVGSVLYVLVSLAGACGLRPDRQGAHGATSGRATSHPLTQTAPDEKSEAEQDPSLGEKPQVRAVMRCAPGRIRTCDTRFRRAVLYPLSYEGAGSV